MALTYKESRKTLMPGADVLSPEKYRQILGGAATVFAQDGYEGASMSRISACAGVSKGTLYNYFDGKAELFAAWVAMECESGLPRVFDIPASDTDPASALHGIGERMLRMMISPAGLTIYRLVVAEASKFPALAEAFYRAGPAKGIGTLASWLIAQVGAGCLVVDDPVFAAEQFFTACQTRIVIERRLGLLNDASDAAIHNIVRAAVTMFLNTYGAKR